MFAALGTVIVTSLSGVMAPGPMFTVTLAKSLKSPWAGMQVSLGHAVIEVPLIMLVYFGLAQFFRNDVIQLILSVAGGGMIVWTGYGLFRARYTLAKEGKDTTYNAFVAGILMSGLNPFFLVWWVTVGSLLLMNFLEAVGTWGLPFFIFVHWLCDLVWLSIVSFAIYRTHKFWPGWVQVWVFVILALALFTFGAQFVFKGIDTYFGTGSWGWGLWTVWALDAVFALMLILRGVRKRKSQPAAVNTEST